jgi:hypothetical protein
VSTREDAFIHFLKMSLGYSMKEDKETDKDELRPAYKRSDFPGELVRDKYSKQLKESSNVIVLRPEVTETFPNEEAVNNALLSLIDIAQKTTRPTKHSTGSAKKRSSR